jgi:hypothetical protein
LKSIIFDKMEQYKFQILKSSIFFAAIALMLGLGGCYYDDEANLYPQIGGCDNANVTYSGTISVIMNSYCNACHNGTAEPFNIITNNYSDLKTLVDNGKLWGAVNHESAFPMPKNGPKLSDCDLSKIRIWIDGGALNN